MEREINDFKIRSLAIDSKTKYCGCEPLTSLFTTTCNGEVIDYSKPVTLKNYQRLSAWIIHYFISRMPAELAQYYDSRHTDPSFRRQYQCATVGDMYLIPGDIITTPIIMGIYHVGIVIGSFNNTVYIADLTTSRGCAEITVRTFDNFRTGEPVEIRRSSRVIPRNKLWHTFNCISLSIGHSIKYQLTSQNCDSFINTVCFGTDANVLNNT